MKEIWKDVPGYEGLYQVSNLGNVRSLNYHRSGKTVLLKPGKDKKGYLRLVFRGRTFQVHRLVAEAFIPNPNNLPYVNHKDWNTSNNVVSNLEWCDARYNSQYRKDAKLPLPNQREAIFKKYIKEHNIRDKVWNAENYRKKKLNVTDS